jgi:Raf kinase inhibitor-like YbhB/YbcL family protein
MSTRNDQSFAGAFAFALLACAPGGLTMAHDSSAFELHSPTLHAGATMPEANVLNGYGCTGGNRSPPLSWSHAPAGTKSFAITMYDPDERGSGSGWWHWIVYNLPANTLALPEDAGAANSKSMPPGAVQATTDFGANQYNGPCPDAADPPHRYTITVYALSAATLDVPSNATPAMIGYCVHLVTLAKASLVVPFARPKVSQAPSKP